MLITNIVEKNVDSQWFQVLAIMSGSLATTSAGIFYAWPSPSIPRLISNDFPADITLEQASYLAVIPQIVAIFACMVCSYAMDKIGRKYCLLFTTIPHLLAWICILMSHSIWMFYLSRVFSGICEGFLFAALPTYVGEIATPKVRGSFGTILPFSIYFGQFLVNAVGAYLDITTTAFVFICVPILFFCTFVLMPESPYYLLMKNLPDQARESLRKLRRKLDVEDELKQLILDVERQQSEPGTVRDLFVIEANRRALYVAAFLRAAQIFSGYAAFSVYTLLIFQLTGGDLSAAESTIIFTGMLAIVTTGASYTVDKFGRKLSMTLSSAGCSIVLALEAVYFYISTNTDIDLQSLNWFPVLGLIIYIIMYSFGLGVIPTLMLSELFSASVKGKGLAAVNVAFNVYISVSTKLFQFLVSNFGLYVPFTLFACCCVLSTIFSFYIVPETKGKTLEEIQQSLKKSKS